MPRKVLILFLLVLFAVSGYAQMGKLFDADQQISSSFTNQVYLDRDGFIWVATRNGLNRYDGYQFHILKKERKQNLGMASNSVNCIMQDRQGLFYVGMYGHFQTFDGEAFHDVKTQDLQGHVMPCYVTCLIERNNGDVLVGTSGHGIMKMNGKTEAKQMNGALGDLLSVISIDEDKKGNLWMATETQGLVCYDGKKIKKYFDTDQFRNNVSEVKIGPSGGIYVGTTNGGLFRFDGTDFQHIEATGNKTVSELYVNSHGELMVGYDGEGMAIYYPATGNIVDNPFFSSEVDLSKSKVYSIVEDRNGNVWLGLLQKGIFMQPGKVMPFGYMGFKLGSRNIIGQACVTSVLVGSNGYQWIGTDKDGLYCLDGYNRLVKHFKENFPSSILSLAEDVNGRIWAGSYKEGCGWIDPHGLAFHHQPLLSNPTLSVFDMASDPKGYLWMATMGNGLLRYELSSGQVKAYTMVANADVDRKMNSLVNDYISQLSLSPDGKRVYLATTMGVCALDIQTENWTSTFGSNCLIYGTPTRIAREYDGHLYVGTNDGLFKYNIKKREMTHLDMSSGLADNGISSIEQDKQGRLWVATDHGLCCLYPKTGKANSYFVDNGLQSNEFSDGASWVSPNGDMLFGGMGGITWFSPADIKLIEWKAEVRLTGFSVNGEPVTQSSKSGFFHITDTVVIASDKFRLSSDDNSFALQLSTLTYDNPEHITYRYRINNEPWVRLQQGANEITFSHLSPGTYHFSVVAERNNVATPERHFTVVIRSPWYRTYVAYLLYLLMLAAGIWYYLRQRRRKEKERMQLQEHIHAEEMADAKLRFFMNISHEIRTPMTLIVTPLLSLMKSDNDPQRRGVYEIIKRNAERILHLINQMMDLRKIDKGMMQMRMQQTDLIAFVKDIYTLFEHQANAKQIQLTYEQDTDNLPVWIDRRNFDKIIVNILSNAFKFTPAGGKIDIQITHDAQNATITISDNGEKIPEEKLDKIFERFYQSESGINDRNVGTGIGLDLTRSLVELHYGNIEAHNLEQGCEFIVSIPLGNAHLKPEEMVTEVEEEETTVFDTEELHMPMPTETKVEKRKGGRRRVVVVEDDDEIREFLKMELGKDYDVKTCINGREGLAEIYRSMPDIVISDIMMPEMDGNALCTQLKTNPSTNHLPIILLTAKNRDEDKLEGLETGADAYIVKPFNMDILRRTMVNLINSHQLLRLKYEKTQPLQEQVEEVKMKSPDQKLLERVMDTINKHLNNPDLSVDMIAQQVGISRVHLHRKMKELTGQTPHDFIRNLRLKQAAKLLSSQNMNITEVVYACGFSNAGSFSTMFKNVYGMSPRDYMKEHQK